MSDVGTSPLTPEFIDWVALKRAVGLDLFFLLWRQRFPGSSSVAEWEGHEVLAHAPLIENDTVHLLLHPGDDLTLRGPPDLSQVQHRPLVLLLLHELSDVSAHHSEVDLLACVGVQRDPAHFRHKVLLSSVRGDHAV